MSICIQLELSDVVMYRIDGLVQEKCNCSALAMELHLSYINPSIYTIC